LGFLGGGGVRGWGGGGGGGGAQGGVEAGPRHWPGVTYKKGESGKRREKRRKLKQSRDEGIEVKTKKTGFEKDQGEAQKKKEGKRKKAEGRGGYAKEVGGKEKKKRKKYCQAQKGLPWDEKSGKNESLGGTKKKPPRSRLHRKKGAKGGVGVETRKSAPQPYLGAKKDGQLKRKQGSEQKKKQWGLAKRGVRKGAIGGKKKGGGVLWWKVSRMKRNLRKGRS